ncbi:MAG: UDP-4-amino-4,6-dideoxy-N-acetyl-beta-L-altrosamine transaminase [Methanoregula sp.]|nr:UDP-4-amino-4,6-dideoxy-N-acetyl-beta-L-altrosamine transaminase [Methanoregula sp.]
MKFIPYGHQIIEPDDISAVNSVLSGDWLTTGPKVPEFEAAVCNSVGCRHAIAVNSGTSALDIAVQSLALPKGSEIITTPLTFMATSNAILYNGLTPVFADILKETRNIDPCDIRKKITSRTKAITFVDFAGHPCDVKEMREIADEFGLILIDDACHALGASYRGKKTGTYADMTIFSFHPVKTITTGEGGMVVTDNAEFAKTLRLLRSHGIDRDAQSRYGPEAGWAYDMRMLGRNYRMTDFQAALGISQLGKIDRFIRRRIEIAEMYQELLADTSCLELPETGKHLTHAWHLFTVLLKGMSRDKLFTFLKSHNIGANVHYIPIYRFEFYRNLLNLSPAEFPVTEDVFSRILTLPLHQGMSDEDVKYVADIVKRAQNEIP